MWLKQPPAVLLAIVAFLVGIVSGVIVDSFSMVINAPPGCRENVKAIEFGLETSTWCKTGQSLEIVPGSQGDYVICRCTAPALRVPHVVLPLPEPLKLPEEPAPVPTGPTGTYL